MAARLFRERKLLVAVLHLPPLPGSPGWEEDWEALERRVRADAAALAADGVDAVLVENFGDAPFHPERVEPITVAAMTRVALLVRATADTPLGINVLRNDARAALAVAGAVGAAFVRVNVHVGAVAADQGLLQGRAHETLRLRRAWGVGAAVFADLAVKHAAPLAARPVEEEAEEAVGRGRADAVILTGTATGRPADLEAVRRVKERVGVPVLAGSGVTPANVAAVLRTADGAIVGSALKTGGRPENPVDPAALRRLLRAAGR